MSHFKVCKVSKDCGCESCCKRGKRGHPGPIGPTGPAGVSIVGPVGPTGPTGVPGVTGPAGNPGVAGPAGDPGVAGPAGTPGVAGPTGPAGSGSGDTRLGQMTDVSLILRSGPNDGDIIQYNAGISKWTNTPGKWGSIRGTATVAPVPSPTYTMISALGSTIGRYVYDDSQDEELQFDIIMPTDYDEGTDIYPFVNFIPIDPIGTSSGEYVEWDWSYIWANTGDTYPMTNNTIDFEALLLPSGQNQNVQSILPPIPGVDETTNIALQIGSSIIGRLIRNINPTSTPAYTGSVALLSFGVYYQKSGTGSTNMGSK